MRVSHESLGWQPGETNREVKDLPATAMVADRVSMIYYRNRGLERQEDGLSMEGQLINVEGLCTQLIVSSKYVSSNLQAQHFQTSVMSTQSTRFLRLVTGAKDTTFTSPRLHSFGKSTNHDLAGEASLQYVLPPGLVTVCTRSHSKPLLKKSFMKIARPKDG